MSLSLHGIVDDATNLGIGPHFQNFLGVVFGDQIPWISKRKITEDQVLIDSQPCILF